VAEEEEEGLGLEEEEAVPALCAAGTRFLSWPGVEEAGQRIHCLEERLVYFLRMDSRDKDSVGREAEEGYPQESEVQAATRLDSMSEQGLEEGRLREEQLGRAVATEEVEMEFLEGEGAVEVRTIHQEQMEHLLHLSVLDSAGTQVAPSVSEALDNRQQATAVRVGLLTQVQILGRAAEEQV